MKFCYSTENTALSVLCYRDEDGTKELWLWDRGKKVPKSRRYKIMKGIMTFYHGTNQHGLDEANKQGYLLHKRICLDDNGKPSKIFNRMTPCTYLAVDIEEAKEYGDVILKVKYNPFKNPQKNNYCNGCWQVRVYEPIYKYEVIKQE